jgi:nicotinate-nucleotide--dimethylbenzimidazole phosphoribosyltransferase
MPAHVVPVAWLCVGYPDERPVRPGLEASGWERRHPLEARVFNERWGEAPARTAVREPSHDAAVESRCSKSQPAWWRSLADAVRPGDASAAIRVRDESDNLIQPAGNLGSLETLLERWTIATGAPPPASPRVAILVFAADHGVSARGVSLYPARVGAQVAAAAARGGTAIGVLARALDAELVVADVGLRAAAATEVRDQRVADGSADITLGPALTAIQLRRSIEVGHALAAELATRSDVIALGDIGIGNTTVAATLLAALTGLPPVAVCGRGTGLDAQGLEHKRAAVGAALAANPIDRSDSLGCLQALGGLELAALAGAILGAAAARRPILLDGFATGVVALATCRLHPAARDYLFAGHRSAEPAHDRVLTELGLEPLLDLRLRLGEASGGALATPSSASPPTCTQRCTRFTKRPAPASPESTSPNEPSESRQKEWFRRGTEFDRVAVDIRSRVVARPQLLPLPDSDEQLPLRQ